MPATIGHMTIHLISCCLEEGNLSYPLGALCIQSAVLSHLENEQCIHHAFTLADDPVASAQSIPLASLDVAGLSVYLWNRGWMDTFALTLKARNPSLHLFAGGPEATANPASFDLGLYDFLILGEGEETVIQALKHIKEGKIPRLPGVLSRTNAFGIAPSPRLDLLSSPLLSGLADPFLSPGASVLWEMTRGCPFHCSFCFESRGERSVRHFSFERLEAELDYLVAHEAGEVYVLDPTFNMDKKRTLAILAMLEKKQAPIHFVFEVRAELLDNALADAFAKIDCSLQIGLQSTDKKVLEAANRVFKADQFAKKIQLLNQRGIAFGLDLIIGLPHDSLASFTKSLDYAMLLKPSNLDIFPLSLLPGTLVSDQASSYGIVSMEQAPYTILHSPTFSESDLKQAMRLKSACDLFFTQGQAGMWMHKLCEATGRKPSSLLTLFDSYLSYYKEKMKPEDEEPDVFTLQEAFVVSLLKKLGNQRYLKPMLSYMELHQGIAFFHMYQESPTITLSYPLEQLALLDTMSLDDFLASHAESEEIRLSIHSTDEGELHFLPVTE